MIVSMHHLMGHRILDMAPIPHLVRAQQDAILRIEATALVRRAPPTPDVLAVQIMVRAQRADLLAQEADGRRVFEEVVAVLLAAGAVRLFARDVAVQEVLLGFYGGGGRGEDAEEGGPGVEGGVWNEVGGVLGESWGGGSAGGRVGIGGLRGSHGSLSGRGEKEGVKSSGCSRRWKSELLLKKVKGS